MNKTLAHNVDAVVIGGNLAGLISAWLLGELGYHTVLLERSPRLGGMNSSFAMPDGSTFDMGMHVLDYMRSPLTTRLFSRIIGAGAVRTRLDRAMVLRGYVMPYAPRPGEMPEELRRLLKSEQLVDDIGTALPTRARIAAVYGQEYANLIFDEVLPSYRCEFRHKQLGVDEARLLTNIYPWFFPRAERQLERAGESRNFHDRLRRGETQYVLYPRTDGFAGFARAFMEAMNPQFIETVVDVPDFHIELEPGTHTVLWIDAHGRRLVPERIFWAANWGGLCKLLGLPAVNMATDNLLLGSLKLNRPAVSDYNEIIIADPQLHLDRVSFPGKFSQSGAAQLQVEFAFPVADAETSLDPAYWQQTWLADLHRIGLLRDDHVVEQFDYRNFRMHFNSFGMEGVPHTEADPALIRADSNIIPVAPSVLNRNLNASVPQYLETVMHALAEPH